MLCVFAAILSVLRFDEFVAFRAPRASFPKTFQENHFLCVRSVQYLCNIGRSDDGGKLYCIHNLNYWKLESKIIGEKNIRFDP